MLPTKYSGCEPCLAISAPMILDGRLFTKLRSRHDAQLDIIKKVLSGPVVASGWLPPAPLTRSIARSLEVLVEPTHIFTSTSATPIASPPSNLMVSTIASTLRACGPEQLPCGLPGLVPVPSYPGRRYRDNAVAFNIELLINLHNTTLSKNLCPPGRGILHVHKLIPREEKENHKRNSLILEFRHHEVFSSP